MSCGCDNGYGYNAYGAVCRPDIPYPQISAESVPSLINNLTQALYGQYGTAYGITKSVVNGQIQWTVPCDPNDTATINGIPRNTGEGLLCYIIRALNLTGPNGFIASSYKTSSFTASAGTFYNTYGTMTVTDPSSGLVEGQSYAVYVLSGNATIGGVVYPSTSIPVIRAYHSGSWYTVSGSVSPAALIQTTSFTAQWNQTYYVSGGGVTVTMPATTSTRQFVKIYNVNNSVGGGTAVSVQTPAATYLDTIYPAASPTVISGQLVGGSDSYTVNGIVAQLITSTPPSAATGQIVYQSVLGEFLGYNGSGWQALTGLQPQFVTTTADVTIQTNVLYVVYLPSSSSVVKFETVPLTSPANPGVSQIIVAQGSVGLHTGVAQYGPNSLPITLFYTGTGNWQTVNQNPFPSYSADPSFFSGIAGAMYFNTTHNTLKVYNGSVWQTVSAS